MNARLAAAVDPIFLYALEVIERLDHGQQLDPQELNHDFEQRLEQGDALLGLQPNWQLAKYALVAWIDEMLVGHAWPGSKWWSNNVLEARLFQTRLCSVRFFELAKEAQAQSDCGALAVYYYCVILGFRGMYGSTGDAGELATSVGVPATLSQWLRSADHMLARSRVTTDASSPMLAIQGARPSNGRWQVLSWALAATVLLVINLVVYRA